MANTEISSMLNCVLVAALAALCLVLAAPRQQLWPAAKARAHFLRFLAVPLTTGALVSAAAGYGWWAAIALVAAGMAPVLLAAPCIGLLRQRGKLLKA
ncbi:hypothetical protein ASF61_17015 [Duganella sp. Leaf126]|uniref:hypothetical protein n=1 Tax=Duganella sp. Leaf126 TaxID=1736266 RepID=UPI0006FC680C|nr:hypothetical protein [Duganella sp. Leaf126]KQQ32032.1 hypothetical protein ASF61_17015 [Duganella sp. Leaf126]